MLQRNLIWIIHSAGRFYTLHEIYPTNEYFSTLNPGVYLIWHPSGQSIYIGQGNIGDRLSQHRQTYQHEEQLLVSWAEVPNSNDLNGIEVYLHEQLNPRDSTCYLTDEPIAVNLPET